MAADFGLAALKGSLSLVGRQDLSAGGCPTIPVGGPEADRPVGNPGTDKPVPTTISSY